MRQLVLFVVDSLGLSGKTRALTNLALGLARERYDSFVVTFAPPEGMLAEQLRAGGVRIEHVECDDGLAPKVVARMWKLMRQLKPAIVHCYNPRPMLYGGLAAAAMAQPAIGTLSAFACMGDDRSYTFLPQPLHTRSRRNRVRNRMLGWLMKRVTAVSPLAGHAFCDSNAIPRSKLRVIAYGVDAEGRVAAAEVARIRAEIRVSDGELLVGSVGRLVEQKDYPNQLRALALAARHSPLRMTVAGAGPLAHELEQLARRLRIGDRVHWMGERPDVPAVLRCFDAFVISSKFEAVRRQRARGHGRGPADRGDRRQRAIRDPRPRTRRDARTRGAARRRWQRRSARWPPIRRCASASGLTRVTSRAPVTASERPCPRTRASTKKCSRTVRDDRGVRNDRAVGECARRRRAPERHARRTGPGPTLASRRRGRVRRPSAGSGSQAAAASSGAHA